MERKWRCTVCGYVHTGDNAPEKCPICNAPKDKFVEITPKKEEGKSAETQPIMWADGHTVGVAQGCDKDVWDGLKAHFSGECCEVGMYLAMSRQADREGYPEIGEAYKRIAFEEAEHAARFAELIGEVVTGSTAENLKMRWEAEAGACADKKRIATKAKELNYDAIHDTVHEMCKDEARHGQIFEGLYKRYFS